MILADLHVHSAASPDGRSTVGELILAAKKRGIQALAICDHDLCTPVPEEGELLLIPSTEVTTTQGHILGLFLEEKLAFERRPTAAQAVKAIHAAGGVAVLAHPFAPQKLPETELEQLPVDAVETQNARAALKKNPANRQAKTLAETMKLPQTGGSDAHCTWELGNCLTRFSCEECSLPALKQALLEGKTQAVFRKACPWRFKGLSRLEKDRKNHSRSLNTYLYLFYTFLRGLTQ